MIGFARRRRGLHGAEDLCLAGVAVVAGGGAVKHV
jgi:hypothetical protein